MRVELATIALCLLLTFIDALAPPTRRAFLQSVALTSSIAPSLAAATEPLIGVSAPDFELPNSKQDGTTKLSNILKQKKFTVLYFYPGAFTQGCTLEARGFQRDYDQYQQLNAQIVGVSVDPPEKNASFCLSENLNFYMLSDVGGRVSKLYGSALSVPGFGVFSNRQTYIIDDSGTLQWVFLDVESRIARHSSEVLEKLKELSA